MQRRIPAWMKDRPEPPARQKPRTFLVRQLTPESNEHAEAADDAPDDALLVVTNDVPKLEAKRKELLAKAEAAHAASSVKHTKIEAAIANASDADAKARARYELDMQEAELAFLAKEIDVRSLPPTSRITFMFRRCAGELSDDARLEGAVLVPGEGAPIPLQFEDARSGRGVTMTADVPLGSTVYVALQLVGLAGVAVEVLLLGGGTIMSVPA
jgi:hypothetical protein